ncbi:MAG: hypothetical protein ACREF9_14765, partial [Opitutaceae bacterium]
AAMHFSAALCCLRAQGDRLLGFGCLAGGGLMVLLAYWGLSDSTDPAQGMAYLASGGIGGLFLVGLGATLILSADLRDSWRKLRLLERSATLDGTSLPNESLSDTTQPSASRGLARVAAGIGMGSGLAIVVFGWNHIATQGTADEAYEGLAVAAAGLLLSCFVAGSCIVVMRRAVDRRMASLLAPLLPPAPSASILDLPLAPGDTVLVADGLRRYHFAGCLAVAGLHAEPVKVSDVPADLAPCLLCTEG